MQTVQTAKCQKLVSNVILPDVELFKAQRSLKEPWGLIRSIATNQPADNKLLKTNSTNDRCCVDNDATKKIPMLPVMCFQFDTGFDCDV